jgi:serine/threonine-protein kinase
MPLEPGALVTPQLRLVRMFGEGGMGSVWVAEHLTLRTHVAVKLITAALSRDGATVARFSREAAAVAQMHNPHVPAASSLPAASPRPARSSARPTT